MYIVTFFLDVDMFMKNHLTINSKQKTQYKIQQIKLEYYKIDGLKKIGPSRF
jgi:hypothetical protein